VTLDAEGEEQPIPDHPLIYRLKRPNPYYDGSVLKWAIFLSLLDDGNAYIGIESNGANEPQELYWLPHDQVRIKRRPRSTNLMDYYEYTVNGKAQEYARDEIVHLRLGIDPDDPRYGMSGYKALKRQQYTLDQAVNYNANILRNFGTVGAVISPKNKEDSLDVQMAVDNHRAKTTGDKVGEILAFEVPVDLQFPKVTPENMALEAMQDRPESDICAVMGVPPQLVNAHVGREMKTYANVKEAKQSFWEETETPYLNMIACQMAWQLLPLYGRDPDKEILSFDTSKVAALQEDRNELHTRAREDWKANLIDRATWKRLVGMKAMPEDEGLFFQDLSMQMAQATAELQSGQQNDKKNPVKALALRIAENSSTNEQVYKSMFGLNPAEDNDEDEPFVAVGNGRH
jgi:HK97 family phage portal protein